ncbi:MAG TPA: AAC(3) family N-acetyltransferase [Gemmatimonadaceae bacterium]|nr:AAC(3) family N-acetyltransferase [Gemmatimonadaceae bacterium]
MHSRQSLASDLVTLGVKRGDVLMVHASVRAVGPIAGGADEIHLAIKDVITNDGTLLMYAGCPRYYDEVGRGNLTPEEEAEVLQKLPPFDGDTARSDRDNGALVEFLRTYPGSRTNQHVARFAVWGKHAEYLISEQPWDWAFGHGSALDKFTKLDGKILLLGSEHDNVTYLHYAEHIANFPDKIVARFKVPVIENDSRMWRDMAEFDTSKGAHANWPDKFFEKIVAKYLDDTGNEGGMVGDATSHLLSAPELLALALPTMESIAANRDSISTLLQLQSDPPIRDSKQGVS